MGAGKVSAIVILLLSFSILHGSAQAKYSGGTGAPDDPYLISTPADMNQIGRNYTDWDKCFKMTADINLSAYTGTQFSRIGIDARHAFSGVFDGNGHTISGFTYTAPTRDYIGVFGNSSGIIENVSLVDVDVNASGCSYVGGLAGYNEGTIGNCNSTGAVTGGYYVGGLAGVSNDSISDCYSAGTVTGGYNSFYLGGLVGVSNGSTSNCSSTGAVTGGDYSQYLGGLVGGGGAAISNCFSTGAVIGGDYSQYLGGLVGESWSGNISNSYSTGSVAGGDYSQNLGGLAGNNGYGNISNSYSTGAVTGGYDSDCVGGLIGVIRDYSVIANCYAAGEVAGDYDTGGLVGLNDHGSITRCYSSGRVSGYMFVGGLLGWNYEGTTTDSFWDTNTSGQSWSDGGTGKTTAEMMTESTFTDTGWDFSVVWAICEGTNYPRLLWSIPPADLVCPDGVNFIDFAFFAEHWLNTDLEPGLVSTVIGDWESPDSNDGWGPGYNDPTAILVPDSNVGVTLGHGSLQLTPGTNYGYWGLTWQGSPLDLTNANLQFDLTMVASEWGDGIWTQVGDKIAIYSDGPSGWKEYGPDSTSLLPYSVIDRDTGEPTTRWWGSWQADANKTYTYNVSDYDATGATWMQINISVLDGDITNGGSFYFDKAIMTSPNAPPLGPLYADFDLSGTVDMADLDIFCDYWLEENVHYGYTPVADTNAPMPNPMTWVVEPNAISDTQITMTATTATEAGSPPVEYFFTNLYDTGHNSGWQSSATFTDSGLVPDTNYGYTVKARDSAPVPNETAASVAKSARTFKTADSNPPTPNPMMWAVGGEPNAFGSDTTITMSAALATDAQGINGYYFTCVNDGNFNSGWKSPTTDSTNWTASTRTFIATGLSPLHTYAFTVKARDNALVMNVTAPSAPASATTFADTTAPDPNPAYFMVPPHATGATTIAMQARIATDSSPPVYYQFYRSTIGDTYLSTWQTDSNFTDTGRTENTTYSYQVRTKDSVGNLTAWSTVASATTSMTIQGQINQACAARGGPPYWPITITIPAGTYNEDLVIYEPNITLRSASGAANTIILTANTDPGISIEANYVTIGSAGHGFTINSINAADQAGVADSVMIVQRNVAHTNISHNTIIANGSTHYCLVAAAGAKNILISNNSFTGDGELIGVGGFGVMRMNQVNDINVNNNVVTCNTPNIHYGFQVNGCVGPAFFTNNTISDINSRGAAIYVTSGEDDVDGISYHAGLERMTINNNTITGCKRGILVVDEYTNPGEINNVTITGNTLQSNVIGIDIGYNGGPLGTVAKYILARFSVTNNNILNSITSQVSNTVTATNLPAAHNWWGAASGPYNATTNTSGSGGSVTDLVVFNPIWTNALMTTDANVP
jgi:hypothetical protein